MLFMALLDSYLRSARFKNFSFESVSWLLKNLYLAVSSMGSYPALLSLMPESASHISIIPLSVICAHDLTSRERSVCWNWMPSASRTSSLFKLFQFIHIIWTYSTDLIKDRFR